LLDVELLMPLRRLKRCFDAAREVQREALRVRGLPDPLSSSQRLSAARSICGHLDDMTDECRSLMDVLDDLKENASELEKLLQAEGSSFQT
jgi:hypothetical protein